MDVFAKREEVEHFAHLASYEEVSGNDYNLSVSTYVEAEDTREKIDIVKLNAEIKEIVARENEKSRLRDTDPEQAYFNVHTDITIPYEELSRIAAVTAQTVEVPIMNDVAEERVEIPILLDGRFVLEGTLKLNEPFEGK